MRLPLRALTQMLLTLLAFPFLISRRPGFSPVDADACTMTLGEKDLYDVRSMKVP